MNGSTCAEFNFHISIMCLKLENTQNTRDLVVHSMLRHSISAYNNREQTQNI